VSGTIEEHFMLLRPEDKSDEIPDFWWCKNCNYKLLYTEWQKAVEDAAEKVAKKNGNIKVSVKWDSENRQPKLLIQSLKMQGNRIDGTRRPQPIREEDRQEYKDEILRDIEKLTGTIAVKLQDYFMPNS
jgi:hypothetical protein